MRLTYTPTSKHSFDIEGSPSEILEFVQRITAGSKENTTSILTQVIEPTARHRTNNPEFTDDFVKSIYLYEANPINDSGRGAYIAQQIMKGETLNIDKLAKRSQGTRSTVFGTIKRMVENGAEIDVSATTVKLIAIPSGPYKLKTYSRSNIVPTRASKHEVNPTTTVASTGNLMSTLSTLKLPN